MEDKLYKKVKTGLGINIQLVMPLIEELTERGMVPVCLIGMKVKDMETGISDAWCATVNDNPEIEKMTLEIMSQFVKSKEQPEETQTAIIPQ